MTFARAEIDGLFAYAEERSKYGKISLNLVLIHVLFVKIFRLIYLLIPLRPKTLRLIKTIGFPFDLFELANKTEK